MPRNRVRKFWGLSKSYGNSMFNFFKDLPLIFNVKELKAGVGSGSALRLYGTEEVLGVELSTSPRYWALAKAGEKPQGFIIHVSSNMKGRDRVCVSPGQKSPPFGSLLFDPGPKAHTVKSLQL